MIGNLDELCWRPWNHNETIYADISQFVRIFRRDNVFAIRRFARNDGLLFPTGSRIDGLSEQQLVTVLNDISIGDRYHPSATTFAQFHEDTILDRLVGHVENGFYVDVGAMDPHLESVTKLFYQRGWQGINIEPRPNGFLRFVADRGRDINLNVAISTDPSDITIFEVAEQPGLSTSDRRLAASYAERGLHSQPIRVPTRRLSDVFEKHAPDEVHFLKIDVEGLESDVLQSMDFKRYRPWILAIESTIPCTDTPSYMDWEHMLHSAGYKLVIAHNINRFYVAEEKGYQLCRTISFDNAVSGKSVCGPTVTPP